MSKRKIVQYFVGGGNDGDEKGGHGTVSFIDKASLLHWLIMIHTYIACSRNSIGREVK